MRNLHALVPALLIFASALPAAGQLLEDTATEEDKKQPAYYDRNEIPGHYTIGFYADESGSKNELKIPRDATEFEVWIGVTGDSTRTFSGLAMSLDLPYGVEINGPIIWKPRERLKTSGDVLDPGLTLMMNFDCAIQKGLSPVMLGRMSMSIQPGINEVVVAPSPHRQFGLSVELCFDDLAWPKPYAEAVPLKVKRDLSLWDRITGLFD